MNPHTTFYTPPISISTVWAQASSKQWMTLSHGELNNFSASEVRLQSPTQITSDKYETFKQSLASLQLDGQQIADQLNLKTDEDVVHYLSEN